jgi:thioredoxin 1
MPYTARYEAAEPARAEVETWPGLTLIEFGAPWCPICQGAQPMLEDLLARHPGVRHLKIEDGRGKPLGRSFAVKLWPTLVLLRDGFMVGRWVRPHTATELVAALARADA